MFLKRLKGTGVCIQVIFLLLSLAHARAQAPVMLSNKQAANLSNIKKYMGENLNADSAFFNLQQFSNDINEDTKGILIQLIHYSLAEMLNSTAVTSDSLTPGAVTPGAAAKRSDFAKVLLNRLAKDNTTLLAATVRPLDLWSKIQESIKNPPVVTILTNEFIEKEVKSSDLYTNRSGRYGLMIYKILLTNPALTPAAERLFTALNQNFAERHVKATESAPYIELQKRSWLRYMYASLNLLKAGNTEDLKQKEANLKTAFENSADRIDLNSYGFYYDMPFLFGTDKISFQNDYLQFLTEHKADNKKILPVLLQMSLADPTYKKQLRSVYSQSADSKSDFQSYWLESVNGQADKVLPIELSLLDDKKFSDQEQNGKWILIDFWGTWCAPCREEHPDLEKLYKTYVMPKQDKMVVLTIACNDTKAKVADYMKEKKFTFPVALSDGKVEKAFAITYYPTKLLITPQGKYMRIPNGQNWVEFVKLYTDL